MSFYSFSLPSFLFLVFPKKEKESGSRLPISLIRLIRLAYASSRRSGIPMKFLEAVTPRSSEIQISGVTAPYPPSPPPELSSDVDPAEAVGEALRHGCRNFPRTDAVAS